MSVRTKKTSSGKTVYQVRRFMGYKADGKPDQRSRNFDTKRAAELYDAQLLAERDAMRGRSGKMTLSQFIDHYYWPVAVKRLAATSLDTYEKEIRHAPRTRGDDPSESSTLSGSSGCSPHARG